MHFIIAAVDYKVVTVLVLKTTFSITWLCRILMYEYYIKEPSEAIDSAIWTVTFVDFMIWTAWFMMYIVNDMLGQH